MLADLVASLFSYAVLLSGLSGDVPPFLSFQPKEFFVTHACGGSPNCNAVGWYPATGGDTIYLLNTLNIENPIVDSIIVHESVHYLQFQHGKFADRSCANSLALEYQAYGVQKEYLLREGDVANGVGMSVISMHCEE